MSKEKLLLLGMLHRQEMHGYQLYEFIEHYLSSCTDLKKPTAYYLLNKMAQDGWVTEEQAQEGNRPPRKVYRLTAAGEQAFLRYLRDNLSGYTSPNLSGDIGLAFLDSLQRDEALALLEKRRQALSAALVEAKAAPQHGGNLQLLVEHQVRYLAGELAWLDEVIRQVELGQV